MDEMLIRAARLDRELQAANAVLAAQARDARGRLVGRKVKARRPRPLLGVPFRPVAADPPPAVA